jgi:small subunit ribosomal protein S20
MPNTKSAERRMRSSARKHAHNVSIKTRLHSLEKKFQTLLKAGKKDEATTALRNLASALDKAAKTSVVHKATASRKKSRLTIRLNAAK